MNTTTSETGNLKIDPDNEIKKLQELVKKLEQQNQQLLRRQNSRDENLGTLQHSNEQLLESENNPSDSAPPQATTCRSDHPNQVLRQLNGIKTVLDGGMKQNVENSEKTRPDISRLSLDCVGLIDIDRISLDGDDSWLYKSPKQTPKTEMAKSPFLWVREEFDQPYDEQLSLFRKSLFYKLEEVTKNVEVEKLRDPNPLKSESNGKTKTDKGDVTEIIGVPPLGRMNHSRSLASGLTETGQSSAGGSVNERGEEPSTHVGKDRRVSESALSNTGYQKVSSASEENLLGVMYRHADVTDVKLLAKMQEESLRMSYNTPLGSSKKMLSKSLNRSSGALVNSCDSLISDNNVIATASQGLNQSTGALLETMNYAAERKAERSSPAKLKSENRGGSKSATNIALASSRPAAASRATTTAAGRSSLPRTAASSSLPGTPYGSNQELSKQALSASTSASSSTHRQSMPNLNRSLKLSVLKSHPSDSRLTATGKKPLSLLRQSKPASSSASTATPVRGARVVAPIKAGPTNLAATSGVKTASTPVSTRSGVVPQSASAKNRPNTLVNTETKTGRVMAASSGRMTPRATTPGAIAPGVVTPRATTPGAIASGATTPGATTPTSRGKPLVVSARKPNTPPSQPRLSGIPKPGSLTKLSIPQKAKVPPGPSSTAGTNDDDDWKEGCF